MTTTAPERTPLTTPGPYEPEPPIQGWDTLSQDIPAADLGNAILRDLRDNTCWLLYSRNLYRAGRETLPGMAPSEPCWVHDGEPESRRHIGNEDAAHYVLTRFDRNTMNNHESWDAPVTDLTDAARDNVRDEIMTLAARLENGAPERIVDMEVSDKVNEWGENINERSINDDMCPVYDAAQEKFNSRVEAPLALPPREKPDVEYEVTISVPWTVTGTHLTTVSVMAPAGADEAEIESRLDDYYVSDYISEDDVRSEVRYGSGDVDIEAGDAQIEEFTS